MVVSSRVKPIEELPSLGQQDTKDSNASSSSNNAATRMEDILSLNYTSSANGGNGSDKRAKKKTTSGVGDEKKKSDKNKKLSGSENATADICDYLRGSTILYADLLRDEIAQVDRRLIVDSKKAGQIGGEII